LKIKIEIGQRWPGTWIYTLRNGDEFLARIISNEKQTANGNMFFRFASDKDAEKYLHITNGYIRRLKIPVVL